MSQLERRIAIRISLFVIILFAAIQAVGFFLAWYGTNISHQLRVPDKTSNNMLVGFCITIVLFFLIFRSNKSNKHKDAILDDDSIDDDFKERLIQSVLNWFISCLYIIMASSFLFVFGDEVVWRIGCCLIWLLVILRAWKFWVIIHDTILFLIVCGIGVFAGQRVSIWQVIVLLVVLSIFDFVVVFKTEHMGRVFELMRSKGRFYLLFVVPIVCKDLLVNLGKDTDKQFSFLGAGDPSLSVMFLSCAVIRGEMLSGVFIGCGGILGMIFNMFFSLWKKGNLIPALPLIAGGSISGYLFSLLF